MNINLYDWCKVQLLPHSKHVRSLL